MSSCAGRGAGHRFWLAIVALLSLLQAAPAAARGAAIVAADNPLAADAGLEVPREIAGLAAAHRRFGRLPWRRLFAPAIRLARDGFPVSAHLAARLRDQAKALAADPALAAIYLDGDGKPWEAGQTLHCTELA